MIRVYIILSLLVIALCCCLGAMVALIVHPKDHTFLVLVGTAFGCWSFAHLIDHPRAPRRE